MNRKSEPVLSGDLKMNSEGLTSGTTGRWDCQPYRVDVKQPTDNQSWHIEAGFNAEGKRGSNEHNHSFEYVKTLQLNQQTFMALRATSLI